MFQCKVCLEKDKRIADLQKQLSDYRQIFEEQIQGLRQLVFTPPNPGSLPTVQVEADRLLSGNPETPTLTPENLTQLLQLDAEAQALLTGTY